MADFQTALKRTLEFEGGYSDDPQDPGGETNYGITKNEAMRQGYMGSMKDIPMSLVENIYKTAYWNSMKCGDFIHQLIANHVFDCGVNTGTGTAGKMLQNALNQLFNRGLVTDGVVGSLTVDSVNALTDDQAMDLTLRFCDLRKQRYDQIIAARPTSEKYRMGWYKRCAVS